MKANKLPPLIKHHVEKHKKLVEEVHEKCFLDSNL